MIIINSPKQDINSLNKVLLLFVVAFMFVPTAYSSSNVSRLES
jgi:hypothetical protein